jgi:hypothetical protein
MKYASEKQDVIDLEVFTPHWLCIEWVCRATKRAPRDFEDSFISGDLNRLLSDVKRIRR